jgi:hypothetical protein
LSKTAIKALAQEEPKLAGIEIRPAWIKQVSRHALPPKKEII